MSKDHRLTQSFASFIHLPSTNCFPKLHLNIIVQISFLFLQVEAVSRFPSHSISLSNLYACEIYKINCINIIGFQSRDVDGLRELIQLLQIKSDFLDEKQSEPHAAQSQEKESQRQCEAQLSESSTNSEPNGREVSGKVIRDGDKQQSTDEILSECSGSTDKCDAKIGVQEFPLAAVTVKKEIPEEGDETEDGERDKRGEDNIQDKVRQQRFIPVRRRSSLNPVNLSLSNPEHSSDSPPSPSHVRSADVGEHSELHGDASDRDTVTKVCCYQVASLNKCVAA